MAQRILHSLDVVTVLEGGGCEAVTEVVESRLVKPDACHNMFKMLVYCIDRQMAPQSVGEHQTAILAQGSTVAVRVDLAGLIPERAGGKPLLSLVRTLLLQVGDNRWRYREYAGFVVFQRGKIVGRALLLTLLDLLLDCDLVALEVNAVPSQADAQRAAA